MVIRGQVGVDRGRWRLGKRSNWGGMAVGVKAVADECLAMLVLEAVAQWPTLGRPLPLPLASPTLTTLVYTPLNLQSYQTLDADRKRCPTRLYI